MNRNEFANSLFAEQKQTQSTTKEMKNIVMNMIDNNLGKLHAMTQSKWILPALMTLAILIAVLGGTGCKPHH